MAPISEAKIAKKSSILALFKILYINCVFSNDYLKSAYYNYGQEVPENHINRAPRFWDVVAQPEI